MPRSHRMKVLFRADASVVAGVGHVMRCLALAQALIDDGQQAAIATSELGPALRRRFAAESVDVHPLRADVAADEELEELRGIIERGPFERVVVDGYQFDDAYHRALGELAHITRLDDLGAANVRANVLVNQNVHASLVDYPGRALETELLLGPRFAALRREFGRPDAREHPDRARRLLVSMGGSDAAGLTDRTIEALRGSGYEVHVVIGPLHPAMRREAALAKASGFTPIVDADDMSDQLQWADMVIGAAGTSALEFAAMGAPAILLSAADNQRPVATAHARAGAAIAIGRPAADLEDSLRAAVDDLAGDRQRRETMGEAGRRLVDGAGAGRVVKRLIEPMTLRPAAERDARTLFAWVNDPAVRAASFNPAPIVWDEHLAWLKARLADRLTRIYLAELGGREVGVARFTLRGPRAVASITVAPEWRGQGIGERLISFAGQRFLAERGANGIDAWMKPGNAASAVAFAAAGYARVTRPIPPPDGQTSGVLMTFDPTHDG
jgi:UDP-2,4-diacetamido-2,4,6-trideoxy-beta-L-altropyranose hydrolase